jgi:hypothetical protein
MVAAGLTFFYCLLLFDAPSRLFRDSDTGWHIHTGERILSTGQLPRTDPYSFSRPRASWFAWEWGSDVLMGAAHRTGGLTGVALLFLTAIAFCSWLWFRLTWVLGGDFLLACALASPFLSTVNLHWLARPHVFSWILLLVWLYWLESAGERFRWRDGLGVFALGVVWTNLHASFFLLPALAGLYALCVRTNWYVAAAATGALGTLVNPYGWALHQHVAAYLTNRELLARVGEFQTFNFHSEGALQILLTVAICAIGGTLALTQRRVHHFLLLFGILFVALRSARGLPVLALLLPFANPAIRKALAGIPGWNAVLTYSANLRRLEIGFRGYVWVPIMLALALVISRSSSVAARTGFPAAEFPVAASAVIATLPTSARILAPDKYGGYLIYKFSGERKVFFDGRSDFYGMEFMKKYVELVQVRPGWRDELASHRFTHALLPEKYSLVAALPLIGWTEVYRDSTAVLLQAPEGKQCAGP